MLSEIGKRFPYWKVFEFWFDDLILRLQEDPHVLRARRLSRRRRRPWAALALPALAQDIQERTIRFGHLNNTDHPTSTGRQEVRRARGSQERRQDHGEGIRQQPAGQRTAAAIGAAGRRAGNARGVHHVAGRHRQGIRPLRLPVPLQQLPSRPMPWSTARWARCSAPSWRTRAWSCWASSTWASATSPTASGPSPRARTWMA